MGTSLSVRIGLRYIRSGRRSLRFVTRVSAIGLVISVATLLVIQGVLAGFEREMRERVLGVLPHVSVYVDEFKESVSEVSSRLPRQHGVIGVSRAIEGTGLLVMGTTVSRVSVTGIDPDSVGAVSTIGQSASGGALSDLNTDHFGIFLGGQLARRLGASPGDSVTLIVAGAQVSLAGVFPRQKRFQVLGIIDTNSLLDKELAYVHIRDAERIFRGRHGAKVWHFRISDPLDAPNQRWRLRFLIGHERSLVADWTDWLGAIYEAIVTQKLAFLFIFSMFVAVAAFNLLSGLVLVVHESAGEVAVLRTIGTNSATVVGIYFVVGAFVAIVGAGGGVLAALFLSELFERGIPLFDRISGINFLSQYLVHELPIEFRVNDVARVLSIAVALCFAATLYPALRASFAKPAEVLRHE